ncbi:MAG: hypothetical protein M3N07_03635 [Pseudomonadota bacterium]|nr:hypothetical protein [Pseudomonadota bacterium]
MPTFTAEQWLILALVFLLGLLIGMALMAGGKWKQRYRDEVRRRQEVEAERDRLASAVRHGEAHNLAADARDDRPDV